MSEEMIRLYSSVRSQFAVCVRGVALELTLAAPPPPQGKKKPKKKGAEMMKTCPAVCLKESD